MDVFSAESAWDGLSDLFLVVSLITKVVSHLCVLMAILYRQPFLVIFTSVNFLPLLFPESRQMTLLKTSMSERCQIGAVAYNFFTSAWAATCKNRQYITMSGVNRTILCPLFRKEIISGNLQNFLLDCKFSSFSDRFLLIVSLENGQ